MRHVNYLLKISTILILSFWGFNIKGFAQEVLIEDFESYTVGENFDGSGDWYNSISCHSVIADAGSPYGKTAKSGSCSTGNGAYLDYSFPFTTQSTSYIKFQGRITSGAGDNCHSTISIKEDNNENFGFGIMSNPSIGVNYQTYLYTPNGYVNGTALTPDIWYDIKLEIDWTYTDENNKYGIATYLYKEVTSDTWIIEPSAENMELHITDPTQFNQIFVRLDGLSSKLGEIDNLIYSNNGNVECNNLKLTYGLYSENDDLINSIQGEFGSNYTITDWTYLQAISDIDEWISCMGLVDDQKFWLTRNGEYIHSGDRHYFVQYFADGIVPGSWAILDQIGDYLFLGSWYGMSLNILSKNGTSSYSDITKNIELTIFPNPTKDHIEISVSSQDIKSFDVELYNIQGKLVYMRNFEINNATLNIAEFSKGLYMLKVKDETGSIIKTEKIIKQ